MLYKLYIYIEVNIKESIYKSLIKYNQKFIENSIGKFYHNCTLLPIYISKPYQNWRYITSHISLT
jgi:hypothetical protein